MWETSKVLFISLSLYFSLLSKSHVITHKGWDYRMQICPFSKSKFSLYEAESLIASTLLHRLVLSIELGTVQTETVKVDPARKFKCTTAARDRDNFTDFIKMYFLNSSFTAAVN